MEKPTAIRKQQEMAVLKANMRCSNLITVVEFSVQTKYASNDMMLSKFNSLFKAEWLLMKIFDMKIFNYDCEYFCDSKITSLQDVKKTSKIPLKSCYPVPLDSTSLLKLFIFGLKVILGKYEFNFHGSKLPFSNR